MEFGNIYPPTGKSVVTVGNATTTVSQKSQLANATDTDPKLIWATSSDKLVADSGASQSTNQFFASRIRERFVGQFLAIAPVFLQRYTSLQKSPIDTAPSAGFCTIQCALELADGAQTLAYNSPNTGGTIIPITFNGRATTQLHSSRFVFGDFLIASNYGKAFWDFSDTTLSGPSQQPWTRTAFSKAAATDNLGARQNTAYNAPDQSHFAPCTSFANAQTLIATSGISSYASGNNFWGPSDSDTLPGPIGWIGIPVDSSQGAILFFGTSIAHGIPGDANQNKGGVNPFGTGTDWTAVDSNTLRYIGWPSIASCSKTAGFPALNFGTGASALQNLFNEDSSISTSWRASDADWECQRMLLARLAQFFTAVIAMDVHNDQVSTDAQYLAACRNWTSYFRPANPKIKIFGARVPNSGVDIGGTSNAYPAALDAKWAIQQQMVTEGWWDGLLDLNITDAGKTFPILADRYTGTATSATTTVITDTTKSWKFNELYLAWVDVNGFARAQIVANDATSFTVNAAYGSAPTVGTSYAIKGNTSNDLTHPNLFGHEKIAAKFLEKIQATAAAIKVFTRLR